MLLYLTSNLNFGLFDFIQEEPDRFPIKKLSGEFNLRKFVIRDMRSFNHIRFIVIDHQALNDTDEELVEGILGFRAMYDARIIYLAEGMQPGDQLLEKLYEAGVRNFITAENPEEIKREIVECISPEGMSCEKAERFKRQPAEEPKARVKRKRVKEVSDRELQWTEEYTEITSEVTLEIEAEEFRKGIMIGVAGIDGKTGATTTALNLACFLAGLGAKVSYIECDPAKELDWLDFYDVATAPIHFLTRKDPINSEDYDFNVLDMGAIYNFSGNVNALIGCDIQILTSGSKAYELRNLAKCLQELKGTSLNFIFSFAADQDRAKLRSLFKPVEAQTIYFSSYSPNLFDPMPNRMIWISIMRDYLVTKLPEEQKKKRLRVS
ncbi:hypothetical protein [Desulfitobacterium chlororespirans]|uniref:CobQ/CobB/MinD/ParA nucleotide binding domain-containing protein n=1 Tax=Desulfitobacterium chlororespirans DSM 11544 TaxID=1121395 RepID=A0A1M7UY73_9FIRM|nr:hypothetical protein [Desulfitobacterium chlororespirans]SHN87895.1 hypothetical protein SAMN02745215_05012 [Desulfitobacterium chlororespirans DSM 11544]